MKSLSRGVSRARSLSRGVSRARCLLRGVSLARSLSRGVSHARSLLRGVSLARSLSHEVLLSRGVSSCEGSLARSLLLRPKDMVLCEWRKEGRKHLIRTLCTLLSSNIQCYHRLSLLSCYRGNVTKITQMVPEYSPQVGIRGRGSYHGGFCTHF